MSVETYFARYGYIYGVELSDDLCSFVIRYFDDINYAKRWYDGDDLHYYRCFYPLYVFRGLGLLPVCDCARYSFDSTSFVCYGYRKCHKFCLISPLTFC